MIALIWLIPIALGLGFLGLTAFFWSIRNGQFDDSKGNSIRILQDEDRPLLDVETD